MSSPRRTTRTSSGKIFLVLLNELTKTEQGKPCSVFIWCRQSPAPLFYMLCSFVLFTKNRPRILRRFLQSSEPETGGLLFPPRFAILRHEKKIFKLRYRDAGKIVYIVYIRARCVRECKCVLPGRQDFFHTLVKRVLPSSVFISGRREARREGQGTDHG